MTKLEKLLDEHGHYWFMAATAKRRPDAFRGGGIKAREEIVDLVRDMLEEAAREGYGEGYYNARIPDAPDEWDAGEVPIQVAEEVLNTPAEETAQ